MMLLATLVAATLGMDALLGGGPSVFDRGDGIVLLLIFSVFAYYTLRDLVRQRGGDEGDDFSAGPTPEVPHHSQGLSIALTVIGFILLAVGGAVTVNGAASLARELGVSEAIIGLTLLAVGTSLPELVASIIASMRGHPDMAVGNVVGSNIFNLLIVLGTTATIREIPVPEGGAIDLLIVILLTTLLWFTSMTQERTIIRTEAVLLLLLYLGYMGARTLA